MGDLLGSPRVAPLFLGLAGYHFGLPLVVPMGSALPIAIGAGRSSIRSPDRKIRAVEISRLGFFPAIKNDGLKRTSTQKNDGCDHTSTNASDPIRTPQLSVPGRE